MYGAGGGGPDDDYRELLSNRRVLVVLDNAHDGDQVRALLRQRQEKQLVEASKRQVAAPAPPPAATRPASVQERLAQLRKELNTLVAMHHHRTKKPHGKIHNQLREYCGGPPTAMASIEQLEERIATLRSW